MVRVADDVARVGPLEAFDHAQMRIGIVGRVIEDAVQQGDVRASGLRQSFDRDIDLAQRRCSGRQDDRCFVRPNRFLERQNDKGKISGHVSSYQIS